MPFFSGAKYWFYRNISIIFKQSTNALVITQFCVLGCFENFLGDFGEYLGGDIFSQRFGKIRRNKKF